jgi:hypothetical protein
LSRPQWDSPSLCSGWTVLDVVAHLPSTASVSPARFALNYAKAGFNFAAFNNNEIREHHGADPVATLSEFRNLQNPTCAPRPGRKCPGLGKSSYTPPTFAVRSGSPTPVNGSCRVR